MSTNQWAIGIDPEGTKIEVALVNSFGLLHDRLRVPKGVKKYALKVATENLEVLPAKLHNDSGLIGAVAFALHSMDKV